MGSLQHEIGELCALLGRSRRIAVFTGAGISTESGIPDFRSPGGIWSRMEPVYFQDFVASEEARREDWRRRAVIVPQMKRAVPNRGHRAVAHLVRRGRATCAITQNIDGLHQRSGIAEGQVIELHGNTTYASCLECGRRHELEPIFEALREHDTLPLCAACGGLVKVATVSFGQPMPDDAMRRARDEAASCDLMLAVGSSLVVYPAADIPLQARQAGARLVILNREPTPLDALADLVLHAEIGPTLGEALGVH